MKYHLVPLGCQMNLSDSERIAAVLESLGYTACEREEDAHILGVVACSVRQKAIDKVYSKIHKWNLWKNQRHVLTFVSGCVLDADRGKFLDRFDLVFAINELPNLPDLIAQYGIATPFSLGDGRRESSARAISSTEAMENFWQIQPHHTSQFEAFVPIQNGCDKFCTYCAVPYTRGREQSRPSTEILAEIHQLVAAGFKSITLLGQNVNSYGRDIKNRRADQPEISFNQLLAAIGQLGDQEFREHGRRFWIYFTAPHPRDMDVEVLDIIARHDCLAKQIHLPLQSGDNRVLERMNRQHDLARYRWLVAEVRRLLPEATLFTDIIVGFSGESEEQYQTTRLAVAEFGFNMAYIAMYSPRSGATSADWPDDVPLDTKKDRLHDLTKVFVGTSRLWNQRYINQIIQVLVEGSDRSGQFLSGRSEGRIPLRFGQPEGQTPATDSLIGRFVRIRITAVQALSMEGELVEVLDS